MWFMIPAAQLEQYLDEGRAIFLVDLREREDYVREHIAGAVNIPDEEMEERMGELPGDRLIVLYCYRGPHSMRWSRRLAGYGYTVADVCGGIQAYRGKYRVPGINSEMNS